MDGGQPWRSLCPKRIGDGRMSLKPYVYNELQCPECSYLKISYNIDKKRWECPICKWSEDIKISKGDANGQAQS